MSEIANFMPEGYKSCIECSSIGLKRIPIPDEAIIDALKNIEFVELNNKEITSVEIEKSDHYATLKTGSDKKITIHYRTVTQTDKTEIPFYSISKNKLKGLAKAKKSISIIICLFFIENKNDDINDGFDVYYRKWEVSEIQNPQQNAEEHSWHWNESRRKYFWNPGQDWKNKEMKQIPKR